LNGALKPEGDQEETRGPLTVRVQIPLQKKREVAPKTERNAEIQGSGGESIERKE